MAQYARGSAVAVIRLHNPPVNALRYRRQGLRAPWERVGDSPVSFPLTSFPLSVRFRPARREGGPGEPQPGLLHCSLLAGARAAPSEGAWISLCKQRAELRRNFCSYNFYLGAFTGEVPGSANRTFWHLPRRMFKNFAYFSSPSSL